MFSKDHNYGNNSFLPYPKGKQSLSQKQTAHMETQLDEIIDKVLFFLILSNNSELRNWIKPSGVSKLTEKS